VVKASDNAFPSILITEGTEPSAPAAGKQRLYIDSTTHKLKRTDSSGVDVTIEASATGPFTAILLDYALAADHSAQAITAGTYFDVFANQNFAVTSATSIIQVTVRGFGFFNDNAESNQYVTRINVDSGGTPILKYLSGASGTSGTPNERGNVLAGGVVFLSGLSVATHTIKVQVTSYGNNDSFFCRASTNGPTTGGEFLHVQVIEHL
jgi:hypothetical protein